MADYKGAYTMLLDAVCDAVEKLEADDPAAAKERLKEGADKAECRFLSDNRA